MDFKKDLSVNAMQITNSPNQAWYPILTTPATLNDGVNTVITWDATSNGALFNDWISIDAGMTTFTITLPGTYLILGDCRIANNAAYVAGSDIQSATQYGPGGPTTSTLTTLPLDTNADRIFAFTGITFLTVGDVPFAFGDFELIYDRGTIAAPASTTVDSATLMFVKIS